MLAPAGYWYILAYEAIPSAPSTWGGVNYSWRSFAYYDGRPVTQGTPESLVAGAQFNHDASFAPGGSTKGAVRAYWWDGRGWVLQPSLNRDWGPRGLADGAIDEPPAPARMPDAGTSADNAAASADRTTLYVWGIVLLLGGAVFWDVAHGAHWTKVRG